MKHILITALLLLRSCGFAPAADLHLAWDASPTPGVTNYTVYAATNALAPMAQINVGTNLTADISTLPTGQWRFYITATKDGLESDPSASVLVEVPEPPANLRIVIVQYSATLTNWQDVGVFKLRLP